MVLARYIFGIAELHLFSIRKQHGERKLCEDFREGIFSSKFTENLSDFWSASFLEKQTHFTSKMTFRFGVSEKQVLCNSCNIHKK